MLPAPTSSEQASSSRDDRKRSFTQSADPYSGSHRNEYYHRMVFPDEGTTSSHAGSGEQMRLRKVINKRIKNSSTGLEEVGEKQQSGNDESGPSRLISREVNHNLGGSSSEMGIRRRGEESHLAELNELKKKDEMPTIENETLRKELMAWDGDDKDKENLEKTTGRADADLNQIKALSQVFEWCSVNDLKNCRLVGSKLWLNASLNSWREKAVLKIVTEDQRNGLSFQKFQMICEQQEDAYNLKGKPFKNVLFREFRREENRWDSKWNLSWMLEKCSPNNLTHVTFSNCKFSTVAELTSIIFRKLQNLVELKLMERITFNYNECGGDFSSYPKHEKLKCVILANNCERLFLSSFEWDKFFMHICNLEDLRIQSRYPNAKKEVEQIVKGVHASVLRGTHQMSQRNLKLKHLEISSANEAGYGGIFLPHHWTKMVPAAGAKIMPLERITASIVDLVHLKEYSKTLKFLDIFFLNDMDYEDQISKTATAKREGWMPNTDDDDITEDSVELPFVKEFHAKGIPSRVSKNLNKVVAPSLKTLLVDDVPSNIYAEHCKIYQGMFELHNLSFKNVTTFECYVNSCARNGKSFTVIEFDEIRQASSSMPNVLHAKMPLTGKAFTELCRVWLKLRTLTVVNAQTVKGVGDDAITGIQSGRYARVGGSSRLPNITNLKFLTDFVNPYELTDLSVNFGFLQLPQLRHLNAKFKKISGQTKAALQEKVSRLRIQVPE